MLASQLYTMGKKLGRGLNRDYMLNGVVRPVAGTEYQFRGPTS